MARTKTTLKKGDRLPGRGRSKRSIILDAIKKESLLGVRKNACAEDVEMAFFGFLAKSAFNPNPETAAVSNTCLNTLAKKGWPDMKSVMPNVEFDLDVNAKPLEQAAQV